MKKSHQLSAMPLLVMLMNGVAINALAEEKTDLDTIEVSSSTQTEKKPTVEHKSHHKIQEELIEDSRDLVRYTTDVGISDNGRHQKGFAMRGVEGNRVGISIDGVSIPDFEENSLYARYGNFNSSRLSIDTELVQGIDIVKGSDSFNSGSGYLGGGVNYRTLDAADIVLPENKFGALIKNAYASKNREWVHTAGIGYKDDKFDIVLLYSQRNGHELKSNDTPAGGEEYGPSRDTPDPSKHKNHSYLIKAAYLFHPNHRLSFSFNGQKNKNNTDEYSYNLWGSAWRETDDIGKRNTLNVAYEYFPTSGLLSYARVDYDWQKTDVRAINNKGTRERDWSNGGDFTGVKTLDEIYDRAMQTKFQRIALRLDSSPFELFGEHNLSFRTGISQHDFENINTDTFGIGTSYQSEKTYTIQHPIRTKQYYFSLEDKINWNDVFSSVVGVRYDHYHLKPQTLNAVCDNCAEIPDGNKFNGLSGTVGLDAKINPTWTIGYNLSSGFRIPSASEMYFTYKHTAGNWLANPNLKAEKSLTHNLSLRGENEIGHLNINLYHTKYRNFLHERETVESVEDPYCSAYYASLGYCTQLTETLYQQAVNVDRAKISGIEINGHLNLDQIMPIPQGWRFMGGLGYSKGKLSDGTSSLAIQPLKALIGLDYEDPDKKWGVFSRLTYFGGKKGKDARTTKDFSVCDREEYDYWTGSAVCVQKHTEIQTIDFPYLNKHAWVFDMFGYYKLNQNVTLRAGVYNLFNRKYQTWDALRGISLMPSTTNSVDKEGKGLQRYYAPGRNYAASVEIRF